MTDEEIIAPGRIVFPNGRRIEVDSLYRDQVCYRLFNMGSDDPDWLRAPIMWFIEQVRKHDGTRPARAAPAPSPLADVTELRQPGARRHG